MAEERTDVATEPRWTRREKLVLLLTAGFAALVLLLFCLCQFLDIHSQTDVIAYSAMCRGDFHPIWKDLALGRIEKGDDLDALIGKHTPFQRGEAGPYTELVYARDTRLPKITAMARDGKLIAAATTGAKWRHVFFEADRHGESFRQAYRKYRRQRDLEVEAYKIHRAIAAGQDVFLSEHVERRDADQSEDRTDPNDPQGYAEMMEQLRAIYGDRYLQTVQGEPVEWAVEVNEVVSGDLEPGTVVVFDELPFPFDASERVFLHLDDDRVLDPRARGKAANLIVPRSALQWYQSLTAEQVQDFETRCGHR